MLVTLVYPGVSYCGFNSFGKKGVPEASFINHGLASIAAYLEKYQHELRYIDLRKLTGWIDFKKKVKNNRGLIFGIGSTTVDFSYAIMAAKIIKKVKPQAIVVIGGVHATLVVKDALKFKCFDYVVTGEGEKAMLEIVEAIRKGKKISRLVLGKHCDDNEIPHINRELFDHRHGEMVVSWVHDLPIPTATILTSRGCPFNCSFCQPAGRSVFGGKVRLRNMSDVVKELVEIKNTYGLESFLIHDDLFLISRERVREFIKLYKKAKINAVFMCQGRSDIVANNEDLIRDLKKVGLQGIIIGFESGSQRILDFLKKGCKVSDNYVAAEICHRIGVRVWANIMLGIPGETIKEMVETLKMVNIIKPEYSSIATYTPFPGTELYDYCKKEGLLVIKDYCEYRRSLAGRKLKGINYNFIRMLIWIYSPWKSKYQYMRFYIEGKFKKLKLI